MITEEERKLISTLASTVSAEEIALEILRSKAKDDFENNELSRLCEVVFDMSWEAFALSESELIRVPEDSRDMFMFIYRLARDFEDDYYERGYDNYLEQVTECARKALFEEYGMDHSKELLGVERFDLYGYPETSGEFEFTVWKIQNKRQMYALYGNFRQIPNEDFIDGLNYPCEVVEKHKDEGTGEVLGLFSEYKKKVLNWLNLT